MGSYRRKSGEKYFGYGTDQIWKWLKKHGPSRSNVIERELSIHACASRLHVMLKNGLVSRSHPQKATFGKAWTWKAEGDVLPSMARILRIQARVEANKDRPCWWCKGTGKGGR